MKHFILPLFAVLLFFSCNTGSAPIATIHVDVDSAKVLEIDTARIIPLQTSDSSMLYDINSLELCRDRFIVHSRNYLRAFDKSTGLFLGDIARSGKNECDFSYIGNIWLDGDTVRFFDTNNRAIYSFSPDGVFYSHRYPFGTEFSTEAMPRQYYRLPGAGVFTVNMSNDHSADSNPRFSFYQSEQTTAQPVSGRELNEPTFLSDGTFVDTDNNRLLSWEPLRDTIFAVSQESVTPLYHVDFGRRSLPADVQAMPYLADRITAFNSKKDKPYASLLRYVQLHEGKIYFSFACGEETNYLACCDTTSGQTSVRHIATPDNTFSQTTFFKIDGDSAFVEIRDRQDLLSNPFLYRIALSDLQ